MKFVKTIVLFLIITSLFSNSYALEKGIITGDGVRLRNKPNGEIITKLYKNASVIILNKNSTEETIDGHKASWYKIKTDKNEEGWVFGYYLQLNSEKGYLKSNEQTFSDKTIDLSSPEDTIKTYCESDDINIIQQCFYPSMKLSKQISKKIWSKFKIIEKKPAQRVGESIPLTEDKTIIINKEDIEIITEVKMIHPEKGNPITKFWYLLTKVNGEWKIISHSHIPDKNYPAYD